jgi:hypothetical protein
LVACLLAAFFLVVFFFEACLRCFLWCRFFLECFLDFFFDFVVVEGVVAPELEGVLPFVAAGLELPVVVVPGLLPVVVVPGFVLVTVLVVVLVLVVVVVTGLLVVVVVLPVVVVVPPAGTVTVVVVVVVLPPGSGTVTVVTPGTGTVTSLLRALAFRVRLLQTAVFFESFLRFFFLCRFASTACGAALPAELDAAAPVAANADAKPAVGVTSRASRQAHARLYALGDILEGSVPTLGNWGLALSRPPTILRLGPARL